MNKDSKLIYEAYIVSESSIENQFAKQVDLIAGHIDSGRRDDFNVHDFLKFKPHIKNWETLESAVDQENTQGESDLWNQIQFTSEDEELRRTDPEGHAFQQALEHFKNLILKGEDQQARDMTERMRVDFNTDWENSKEDLAFWLVSDGGYDGASASELLDREVNDHGDIVDDEAPW
tara:strand:+ start:43 stop:570 length:528 start_codon:yes stop_codon:yes gene_type:complete